MLTGGKGVHVVVPLTPQAEWPLVTYFTKRFATALSEAEPERFTATMSKARRKGRIFVDWLRNQRGSTAIMPYAVRARPDAPVAAPVTWDELADIVKGRSEEHTSELQSLMRISYAVFCLKKKKNNQ